MTVGIQEFYILPRFGVPLSEQWKDFRETFAGLNAVGRAAYIDESSNPSTHAVAGWTVGQLTNDKEFRIFFDKSASTDEFKIQLNTGTQLVPSWSDCLTIRKSDCRIIAAGQGGFLSTGGFYNLGGLDIALQGSSGGAAYANVGTLLFDANAGFYFSSDSSGRPVVSVNVAAASGTVTTASNLGSGGQIFKNKTASTLNLRSVVGGDNITVVQNDNDVTINASVGETNTASNVGSGEGVFSAKAGVDLQFKSLIAGNRISLSSDSSEITITGADQKFYGVTFAESGSGVNAFKNDTLVVDYNHFYLALTPTAKPFLSLQPSQTLSDLHLEKYLDMEATVEPATPAAGHVRVWSQDAQGHTVLNYKDDDAHVLQLGRDNVLVARNSTGSQIDACSVVYISGTTGQVPQISLAKADSTSTMPAIGIVVEDIANNGFGLVMRHGRLTGCDTSAFTAGDDLWVSATTAGAITATEPSHPNLHQQVGTVISASNNGVLLVEALHADGDDTGTNNSSYTIGATAAASMVLQPSSTAQRTFTFPNKSGTVATTDDVAPGFYGITAKHADGSASFSGLNVLSFDEGAFYLTQNSPNTDEVQIQVRNRGEKNTASNLGAGEGLFSDKSGVDLRFKSLVAGPGVSLSSDANQVTIENTQSGFYGILFKETGTVGFTAERDDEINFNTDHFYLAMNGSGKPVLSLLINNTASQNVITDGNGRISTLGGTREVLTADRTYYVRSDGSDSNDGLSNSATGAFLTLQAAVNVVAALDLSVYDVTIQIGLAGTYAGFSVDAPWIGGPGSSCSVVGDTSNSSSYVISSAITSDNFAVLRIRGVDLTTSENGVVAQNGGVILIDGVTTFGACTSNQMFATGGGRIVVSSNYTIDGGGFSHWQANYDGYIGVVGRTVTLTGTPAFNTFAYAANVAAMEVNANTFSGSATGTRYDVSVNAVVNTGGGGATYLPGDVAGTTATGGQYV